MAPVAPATLFAFATAFAICELMLAKSIFRPRERHLRIRVGSHRSNAGTRIAMAPTLALPRYRWLHDLAGFRGAFPPLTGYAAPPSRRPWQRKQSLFPRLINAFAGSSGRIIGMLSPSVIM
ncbi:hypothetical protein SBBP2_1520004 [Burkholderiales bacterium]|nr:hypothetical protein SBBP2_1520004 [Burkholderiales bacterium]